MAFGKSTTPHRTPLQRLNDQRRSLALAGLAAGAVVAAVFRRKKGGGEAEFGDSASAVAPPEPVAPQAPTESGPPAAVEIPSAASEPAAAEATPSDPSVAAALPSEPAQAAAEASASEPEAAAPSPDPEPASIVEPATGELSAEEASILAVLAQSGRTDEDRTAIAVATSLERETPEVTAVLRKLGAEGVVSGDLYTAAGDKIWAVTERGVRRLGAQH